jgi:hypothetical protein
MRSSRATGEGYSRHTPVRIQKEETMCLTCGCGQPNEDHGDPAHITYDDLKKAADAAEISIEEAASNLQETLAKA